jgi:hypothetical protein
MQWEMYAYKFKGKNGVFFEHPGEKRWVELFHFNEPIVKVRLTEDENGQYWGWLDKDETEPSMIWPSEVQFRMCFPYGYEAEEKAGKGKAIRLSITEIENRT